MYFAIIIGASLVIRPGLSLIRKNLVAQSYQMPAGSMAPALLIGDRFIVDRLSYYFRHPYRGEIVLFRFPRDESRDFLKRVVGIPGDTVEIRAKRVFINGTLLREDYAAYDDARILSGDVDPRDNFGPTTLSREQFFVLGDNRDHSHDSRYFGPIRRDSIKGQARTIFFSWDEEVGSVRWGRAGMQVR
ncbi:MAG: signal peptidase I [Nitrospirae bacterium]|nr:signal peptidase I [Nitrospirota bacterium]